MNIATTQTAPPFRHVAQREQRVGQPHRIRDVAVTDQKRTLGRFHQTVDMIEPLRLFDSEPIEQRQQDERRDALGRRRRIEQGAGADLDG